MGQGESVEDDGRGQPIPQAVIDNHRQQELLQKAQDARLRQRSHPQPSAGVHSGQVHSRHVPHHRPPPRNQGSAWANQAPGIPASHSGRLIYELARKEEEQDHEVQMLSEKLALLKQQLELERTVRANDFDCLSKLYKSHDFWRDRVIEHQRTIDHCQRNESLLEHRQLIALEEHQVNAREDVFDLAIESEVKRKEMEFIHQRVQQSRQAAQLKARGFPVVNRADVIQQIDHIKNLKHQMNVIPSAQRQQPSSSDAADWSDVEYPGPDSQPPRQSFPIPFKTVNTHSHPSGHQSAASTSRMREVNHGLSPLPSRPDTAHSVPVALSPRRPLGPGSTDKPQDVHNRPSLDSFQHCDTDLMTPPRQDSPISMPEVESSPIQPHHVHDPPSAGAQTQEAAFMQPEAEDDPHVGHHEADTGVQYEADFDVATHEEALTESEHAPQSQHPGYEIRVEPADEDMPGAHEHSYEDHDADYDAAEALSDSDSLDVQDVFNSRQLSDIVEDAEREAELSSSEEDANHSRSSLHSDRSGRRQSGAEASPKLSVSMADFLGLASDEEADSGDEHKHEQHNHSHGSTDFPRSHSLSSISSSGHKCSSVSMDGLSGDLGALELGSDDSADSGDKERRKLQQESQRRQFYSDLPSRNSSASHQSLSPLSRGDLSRAGESVTSFVSSDAESADSDDQHLSPMEEQMVYGSVSNDDAPSTPPNAVRPAHPTTPSSVRRRANSRHTPNPRRKALFFSSNRAALHEASPDNTKVVSREVRTNSRGRRLSWTVSRSASQDNILSAPRDSGLVEDDIEFLDSPRWPSEDL